MQKGPHTVIEINVPLNNSNNNTYINSYNYELLYFKWNLFKRCLFSIRHSAGKR